MRFGKNWGRLGMKSEWTYRPLGELVSFASGGTPSKKRDDYWGGTIPWISAKTLKTENIDTSDLFITEEGLKAGSKIAPKGSILLLTRGSGLFNGIPIARVEKDVAFNQDIKCLDSYGEVENEFIFYWLLSQKDYLMAKVGVTGIGAGKFDLDFLQKLMVPIPSERERKSIVGFASSISEKIRCNAKVDDNLQQQANLIFDELVGRLIPTMNDSNYSLQLHEIGSLDILVTDYVANGSFKSLADNVQYLSQETDNVLIRLTDYNNNFSSDMVYISDESYNFLSKSKLYGDEIIISNVGANVGTVFRCPRLEKRMSLAPNAIMLRSDKYEHYLYLYFISHYGQQQLQSIVTGSAQPKFNKTNFRSLKVILPDEATLSKITDMYTPMYEQIVSNLRENRALTEIRDSLLPKLMSGELDVSCVQI